MLLLLAGMMAPSSTIKKELPGRSPPPKLSRPAAGAVGAGARKTARESRLLESGELRVLLKSGTGLKAADLNRKTDPYVIVCCGKQQKKSRVVKKTLDPVWNEEVAVTGVLQDLIRDGLLLKVFDWDAAWKVKRDDPLGDAVVPLDWLKRADAQDFVQALPTQGSVAHMPRGLASGGPPCGALLG